MGGLITTNLPDNFQDFKVIDEGYVVYVCRIKGVL